MGTLKNGYPQKWAPPNMAPCINRVHALRDPFGPSFAPSASEKAGLLTPGTRKSKGGMSKPACGGVLKGNCGYESNPPTQPSLSQVGQVSQLLNQVGHVFHKEEGTLSRLLSAPLRKVNKLWFNTENPVVGKKLKS